MISLGMVIVYLFLATPFALSGVMFYMYAKAETWDTGKDINLGMAIVFLLAGLWMVGGAIKARQ